jgi:hypothetical protein
MLKQNVVLKYAIKIKLEILKREIWENMGKYGKIWENMKKYLHILFLLRNYINFLNIIYY